MRIEQIYTNCLAQGAYYVESEGEVAIIDPLREVQTYLDKARLSRSNIKYIFETHFHADFVSGHVTLSEKTGAPIIFGPTAQTTFDSVTAKDGQEFPLGKLTIVALHTPGHTMESTTYLLRDENGKDFAIFSGDTLFLGDVGRPDLAQKSANITQEDLAGILYDSLRTKIMPLSDDVIVYPAHGAGSACGKNLSKETIGTLGDQKKSNYALRADMTREEFIKEVTEGLLPPPGYFPENVRLNKNGYKNVEEIVSNNKALDVLEFQEKSKQAMVLDVRDADSFAKGHIPGAIFIGIDGGFAPWVGALIKDIYQPILLVTPQGREEETIVRLSRVGYDNTLGYLKNGMQSWIEAKYTIQKIERISANNLENLLINQPQTKVVDVRKPGEYTSAHIKGVPNLPLDYIHENSSEYSKDQPTYLHCAGGYRSMIAASILKAKGHENVLDVIGGFGAIKKTSLPIDAQECNAF